MSQTIGRETAAGIVVDPNSAGNRFRTRRFALFLELVNAVIAEKGACNILDVGGTHDYWHTFGAAMPANTTVTLLNLGDTGIADTGFLRSRKGDGCAMPEFDDNAFDLVHSNSVIEHVGLFDRMAAMAGEVRRVAPRHFVQTPNYWFPVEPHCRVPFYQFLPEPWRVSLILRRSRGFWPKAADIGEATGHVQSAILLDYRQMAFLFPDAEIHREKFFGLTKSLVAIRR